MQTEHARVGVLGFSGYGGAEAVRLLRRHPQATPVLLEHRDTSGDEAAPWEEGLDRVPFTAEGLAGAGLQAALLATSHEVSLEAVPLCLDAGVTPIDLSGAYRLGTVERCKRWYGFEHPQPELLAEAVYAMPEIRRDGIADARLISNPGCYPTAASIALEPLVAAGVIDRAAGIVCDAKSGVSGAGRKASMRTHYCETTENFSAYGLLFHRHTPEVLANTGLEEAELSLNMHLLPVHRGILESIYLRTKESMTLDDVAAIYRRRYENEPFIRLRFDGRTPNLRDVQRTNYCDLGLVVDPGTRRVLIVAAIDNLVKGAAGQAIQNLNLRLGFEETAGLLDPADGAGLAAEVSA